MPFLVCMVTGTFRLSSTVRPGAGLPESPRCMRTGGSCLFAGRGRETRNPTWASVCPSIASINWRHGTEAPCLDRLSCVNRGGGDTGSPVRWLPTRSLGRISGVLVGVLWWHTSGWRSSNGGCSEERDGGYGGCARS